MTNPFRGGLRKVLANVLPWMFLPPDVFTTERTDPKQLKACYRTLPLIRPIVDLAAGFVLGKGFSVSCTDQEAQDRLNAFYDAAQAEISRAMVEFCLGGQAILALDTPLPPETGYEPALDTPLDIGLGTPASARPIGAPRPGTLIQSSPRLKVIPVDSAKLVRDIFDLDTITHYEHAYQWGPSQVRQVITSTNWILSRQMKVVMEQPNPFGFIPVVVVDGMRFSDEIAGESEVDPVVHDASAGWKQTADRGVATERYHGAPLTVVRGSKDFNILKPKLEGKDAGKVGFTVFLPDPKASIEYLESKRPAGSRQEILDALLELIIIQTGTPKFLLGAPVPGSAHASTKEQLAPYEQKITRLRSFWTPALKRLNEMVLRIVEIREFTKYQTYETKIEWPSVFPKNEVDEADALKNRAGAAQILETIGVISHETIQEDFSELITDPEREQQRLAAEKAAADLYARAHGPTETGPAKPAAEAAPPAPQEPQ